MNQYAKQRGSILLIAIALIVGVSLLAVAFTSLYVGDTASSADHATASQALFVAESGLSNALENYRTGTACAALNLNNVAFGNGTFTTIGTLFQPAATTTTAAITALSTVIPVNTTAGYAPHGRITIQAEQIDYAAIAGNTFTGARRGVNGTVAAAHANGQAVTQNQCLVRSTGTVGAGVRVVEAGVAPVVGATRSDFLSTGASGFITTPNNPRYLLGSLISPTFAAGTNVIVAAVALQNIDPTRYDVLPPPPANINPPIPYVAGGWLRLRRGGTTLVQNSYQINVGAKLVASPSVQNFPRETMFLLARQTGVPANPTYYVDARASSNSAIDGRITGEVKMVAINNPPSSAIRIGSRTNIGAAGWNLINNQTFAVPAGARVLLATVQLYNRLNNGAGQIRTIPAGAVQLLKRVGAVDTIIAQNEYAIDLTSELTGGALVSRVYAANRSTSLLLVASDPNGGNNQRYTLRINTVVGGADVNGSGQVVVMGLNANVSAMVTDGASTAVGAADTILGSLATTFGAGEQVVIASTQYQNAGGGTRLIAAGDESLVVGGVTQSQSQFGLNLCDSATSVVCDDFGSGLLWRTANGPANPTYEVHAQADAAGINAEAKILAIRMATGVVLIDWLEVVL
ncbi:MAG TPA: hypothetical protein VJ396_01330 [Acidiferrobacterales bacterium]|nr:hypothetical protein [Acidiferrobacterales bacterium]